MLNSITYVNMIMRSTCAASSMTSGRASDASSQSLSAIIAMPRNRERLIPSQVIYLSHMDGGDSCVLTYVSHECGCEHRSYIYWEGEPSLCEKHCKDGSDTYCQDKLEYGISVHICVALMLFSSSTSRLSSPFAAVLSRLCFQ